MNGDPLEAVVASLGLGASVVQHASGGCTVSVRARGSDGLLFLCVGDRAAEDGSVFVAPVAARPVVRLGAGGDGWCASGPLPAGAVTVTADAATTLADQSYGVWLVIAPHAQPLTATFADGEAGVVTRHRIAPPARR